MRPSQITGIALGAFFTVTTTAFAQTPPTQPPPTQTFAGCLMTERDYRTAHNLGAGQVGGVGLGDEFVLVDAKVSPAKASAASSMTDKPAANASAVSATVTSKCDDKGTAYRLTGSDEEQLKTLVGRHVEIQGRFKNAGDAAGSGARPEGTLPAEVEIVSFAEVPAASASDIAAAASPRTVPPASPPVTAPPPPPPAQVATPQPATTPATAERRELPATASTTALLALIGVVALSSGFALSLMRRRSVQ